MRIQTLLHGGMAVGLGLALAACNGPTENTEGVLMRVNDTPITIFDFNLQQVSGGVPKDLSEASQQQVLDELLRAELMYQKGVQLGLDKDPGFQRTVALAEAKLTMLKRQEMQQRVYEREIASQIQITDEQAKQYYDQHQDEITHEYHLGSLQFPEQQEALEVLQRIRGGESFKDVASSVLANTPGVDTDNPQNVRNLWDMDFVHWKQIPPNIMAVIAELKEGDVSEPIPHEGAGHIVLTLLEKREVKEADFPSMRPQLKEALRNVALREREDRFFEALKAGARIQQISMPQPASAKPAPHP